MNQRIPTNKAELRMAIISTKQAYQAAMTAEDAKPATERSYVAADAIHRTLRKYELQLQRIHDQLRA